MFSAEFGNTVSSMRWGKQSCLRAGYRAGFRVLTGKPTRKSACRQDCPPHVLQFWLMLFPCSAEPHPVLPGTRGSSARRPAIDYADW